MPNIVLLCLTAEFVSVAQAYTHSFDNKGGSRGTTTRKDTRPAHSYSRIAHAARSAAAVRERLSATFEYRRGGQACQPLVLDDVFTTGFMQIATKTFRLGARAALLSVSPCSQ